MPDMLVKLYTLPDSTSLLAELKRDGIEIRQAHPCEKHIIADWACQHFNPSWATGCEAAIEQRPISCYIATQVHRPPHASANPYDLSPETLLGFALYDVASKGMFGPIGVREDRRGRGIGKALLLACLQAMAAERYAYAIIGWAGPLDFYIKAVGATIIEGSEPGIFRGALVET